MTDDPLAAVLRAGPETPAPPPAKAAPAVVDLDAGPEFGRVEYVFKRPFKLHGLVRTSLSLREPQGRDLLSGPSNQQLVALLAGFEKEPELLDMMHAADAGALYTLLGKLLADGPSTLTQ